MLRFIFVGILFLASFEGAIYGQCEATAPVRQIVERSRLREEHGLTKAETYARQVKILEDGLTQYPNDYFLLQARMHAEHGRDAQIQWAQSLQKRDSSQPIYDLLYATAMEGKDTPLAIKTLEALKIRHAEIAPTYLELAYIARYGKFEDRPRLGQELDGFLKLCPATLDANTLGFLLQYGTREQIGRTAPVLRKRLQQETDPLLSPTWEALWTLEFKAVLPVEQGSVRERIAQDVAGFEKSPDGRELDRLTMLRTGYEKLNDQAAREKIGDEILNRYPASAEASRVLGERWAKQYPKAPDDANQAQAFYRGEFDTAEAWHKRWPDNSAILYMKFRALTQLKDTSAKQIVNAAHDLLAAYRDPQNYSSSLAFGIARAFVKHKTQLEQVPALVDAGYATTWASLKPLAEDDRRKPDPRSAIVDQISYLALSRADILLDYYELTKQAGKVRELDQELASLKVTPPRESWLLATRARAAELTGRKLDSLVLYRAAIAARTDPPDQDDNTEKNLQRLWKELGGSPPAYDQFLDTAKLAKSASAEGDWARPANPLPEFSLSDLEGKTWKLSDLSGKAFLINIWATWCGPCREELPEVQKLYEKLKDRKDVAVLTLNVDDDVSKVAPYMQNNKYTFPVLLSARDVALTISPSAYPQNWIVNSKGKVEWVRLGFNSTQWQETMNTKLQDALKPGQ
jgi:thiol-disulfide isomerase/thioredoxin